MLTIEPGQRLMLTPNDLVALLCISRAKLFRMLSSGLLPAPSRFGRLLRWRQVEILAWVAAQNPPREQWERIRDQWIWWIEHGGERP